MESCNKVFAFDSYPVRCAGEDDKQFWQQQTDVPPHFDTAVQADIRKYVEPKYICIFFTYTPYI